MNHVTGGIKRLLMNVQSLEVIKVSRLEINVNNSVMNHVTGEIKNFQSLEVNIFMICNKCEGIMNHVTGGIKRL